MRSRRAFATQYAGVRFRSEEEARWAACFDALGLAWDYEPSDLGGYIPNFIVRFPDGVRRIVEVKRLATGREDLRRAGAGRLERSAWDGEAVLVGNSLLGGGAMGLVSSAADGWKWKPFQFDGLGDAWKTAVSRTAREPVVEEAPSRERIRATTSETPVPQLVLRRLAKAWAQRRGDSEAVAMQWVDIVTTVGKESVLAGALLARAAGVDATGESSVAVRWGVGTVEHGMALGYMRDELCEIFQRTTGHELVVEEWAP